VDQRLEVRRYGAGEEEEIVRLLRSSLTSWPGFHIGCDPLDHWRWKYLDNPLKDNLILISTLDDRIIGVAHYLPLRIKVVDALSHCTVAADSAVYSDFRNKGIARRMYDWFLEHMNEKDGIPLMFFSTENPHLIKMNRKLCSIFPFKIKHLARVKDIDRHLSAYYHREEFEPEDRITAFDRMRLHYVAFSRAEKILVLTTTEYSPCCSKSTFANSSVLPVSPAMTASLKNHW